VKVLQRTGHPRRESAYGMEDVEKGS